MSLTKKIQNTVFQHELFGRGDKIILAVSGGPDSACMLDIFVRLQKKYSLELMIAHVNYGLRGKDSDKDEKFVRELAGKYGMRVEVLNAPTTPPQPSPEYRGGGKAFSENYLRDIRYEFFERVRRENNFDLVAVAHNADDQVETFLMRVIRGSGLQGLSSMKFKNKRIIRPLLSITRAEIMEYLQSEKLTYRTDQTNLESKFLRNKIRNKLLPYLEKEYNPNIRKTIFNSTFSIALDYDFILGLEKKALAKFSTLEISRLMKLHPAMQRRVLRGALARVKNDLKGIDALHVEEILKIAKSTKNKPQVVILPGLKIRRKGDKLEIVKLD